MSFRPSRINVSNVEVNDGTTRSIENFLDAGISEPSDPSQGANEVSIDTPDRAETISLKSLDAVTINPDTYGSPDEDAPKSEWVLVGQPDSPSKEDLDADVALIRAASPGSDNGFEERTDLDLDRQKTSAQAHTQRRLKSIKRFLENMELCDLTFSFGKTSTPAHAMMFRIHEGFCERFPHLCVRDVGVLRAPLQLDLYGEVTATAFRAVMDYIYDGQCEVRRGKLNHLR